MSHNSASVVLRGTPQARNQMISIDELWDLLRARKYIVLIFAILVCNLVLFHHFMFPSYKAQTSLLVQRAENSPLQAMMSKMGGVGAFAGSKTNEYQDKYLLYLASHNFYVAAAKKMMVDPEMAELRKRVTRKSILGRIIQSIVYVKIEGISENDAETETLARFLKGTVKFRKGGYDNINVTVTSRDHNQAVRLVNFLSQAAVDILVENEISELTSAIQFIHQQLELAEKHLKEFDSAIVDFRKNSKYFTADAVTGQALGHINRLREGIQANRLKIEQNTKLISQLSKELRSDKTEILTEGAKKMKSSDVVNQLLDRIQSLRYNRILLLAQGETEKSRQIENLDQSLEQYATQLKQYTKEEGGTDADVDVLLADKENLISKISFLKRENQYIEARIEAMEKTLSQSMEPLHSLPEAAQKLIGFNRGTAMEFGLYQEMRKRLLELTVEQISLKGKIRVLERATIASIPLRLNVLPKLIIAFISALLMGGLGAFGLERMDTTVKDRKDFDDLELASIGSVPTVTQGWFTDLKQVFISYLPERWRPRLPIDVLEPWRNNLDAPEIMAFNHIRARILKMRSSSGEAARVVAITSSRPGEGKSFTSANIALSLAHFDKRVLLIDSDLRRSSLPEKLGLPNDVGLGNILSQGVSFDSVVIKDLIPRLDVLVAGHSGRKPTELISGRHFSQLLRELREKYDYIIIDTPPVLPVVDAIAISNLSDVLILCVSFRKTKWKHLQASVDKLRQMDQKAVYAILNQVPEVHEYIYLASPSKGSPANENGRSDSIKKSGVSSSAGVSADQGFGYVEKDLNGIQSDRSSKIDVKSAVADFRKNLKREET